MTEQENEEFVKKASKLLKEHLTTTLGYPKCTANQIMQQLPQMWAILNQQGLVKPGMTYQAFTVAAQQKYMDAEINRILGL